MFRLHSITADIRYQGTHRHSLDGRVGPVTWGVMRNGLAGSKDKKMKQRLTWLASILLIVVADAVFAVLFNVVGM